jgi:N-acetylglucosaminyldiphosphoundecaprenol N-acetyl-beta-D-mannosaminyltransferase
MEPEIACAARRDLLGLSFDALTMTEVVARCVEAVEHDKYLAIGVANAAKIMGIQHDDELRRAVAGCGIVLADGQSVVWASRLLGVPLPERVAGIDLFMALLAEASLRSYRVYFLGARPDVLARMVVAVEQKFPGLKVAGVRNGYFSPDDENDIVEEIRNSGADLLFLGMSSPKKELFISRWGEVTGVRVAHGVGGSFDVLAGVTDRAPAWWQRHGLEWLYRALQEPTRLGPRYLRTNATFIGLVTVEAAKSLGCRWAISSANADRLPERVQAPVHVVAALLPGQLRGPELPRLSQRLMQRSDDVLLLLTGDLREQRKAEELRRGSLGDRKRP